MARKLTKKQEGFVKDFVATGNGTKAVLNNYDTVNPDIAASMATENLGKPKVIEAIKSIGDHFSTAVIAKKHKQLLNAMSLEKLYFDEADSDETIEAVVKGMEGYTLLHIVENKSKDGTEVYSKYAYVKAPDNQTQDKALDKIYKIKGLYATDGPTVNIGKIEAVLVKFIDGKDNRDTNRIPETI